MAGSMLRAVKWGLVATVVATGGAGAYQFTSGGGTPFWRIFGIGGPDAGLVAEETPANVDAELSQSDLDAVASAWAGTNPTNSKEAVAAGGDRYAAAEIVPVDLPASTAREVTRGQEPESDDDDDTPVSAAADGDDDEAEAGPISFGAKPSSDRAREAFGRKSSPAAPTSASSTNDRYGMAADEPIRDPIDLPGGSSTVNPFESQSDSSPRKLAAKRSPIAPAASEVPQELDVPSAIGRSETSQPANLADSQPDPIRTANASYRTSPESGADLRSGGLPETEDSFSIQSESFGTTGDGTGRPGERALEGPQKPALVIQKFAPPEIQVGKPAKFAIQVRNEGSQTAEGVVIRDEVPHGTRVISTSPRAESDGNHLVWDLGALSTGEERTVEIQLMPIAEGEIGSVANVSYVAQASAKTRCTMPQLAIRMTAPGQVMIGQEQRVKIELRNPGTGDASNVMIFENVPENLKHAAGPALEFEIGTLRAGETRELELVLTAERAGPVVNALTARADGNLQVQQQVEFEVIAPALQLTVDGPARRYLERPATYQVFVENPGTAPAHDIELVTKLPKGMQFVRANNMGEYDAATHSVYWSLAELPEGEKGSVELVAMPVEPGQQTLEIEGKAQQGLTDEVKQDVLIEGLAAIMFEVRDAEDPIEVGGETSYEIRVVNQGSKAATNVQVVVSLPPGMEAISATGETRYTSQSGGVVFEPLPQLAPKADSIYRVQVKGVQPGDQRVTVQVNTDDISQPIRREESTRVFGDE